MRHYENVLDLFPKTRPELPDEFKAIYEQAYKANRSGGTAATSLAQKMESWLHRQVAKDVIASNKSFSTLEIGAGNLNQIQYEPPSQQYDIIEPFESLFKGSPLLSRIRNIYSDIADVPDNALYERVTAIATFEHICDLPEVVAKTGLLLKPEGSLRVSIPSEGTFMWTLGWKLTTGLEFRARYGLDYGVLMRNEHVNTAIEIEDVLRYFYSKVTRKVFGISRGISFYQFFECTQPNIERCKRHLHS